MSKPFRSAVQFPRGMRSCRIYRDSRAAADASNERGEPLESFACERTRLRAFLAREVRVVLVAFAKRPRSSAKGGWLRVLSLSCLLLAATSATGGVDMGVIGRVLRALLAI